MNESTSASTSVAYQVDKFCGTSTAFNYFITQLLVTGFLNPGNVLIYDNASIHMTEENKTLADFLWEQKTLMLNLPPHSPKLNPIKLIFQLLGHCLCHSNARHLSHQMMCEDFFLIKCVEVLESFTDNDIRKSYKKCGHIV